MPEQRRFLTIGEAAEFLHVSEVSLRRWTNSGKLRCFRVGGRNERRFLREDLIAFMPSEDTQARLQSGDAVESREGEHETHAEHTERHISLFFRDAEDQWELLRPFVVDHLKEDAPVVYLQHSSTSEQLMGRLHEESLPLDSLIAQGLLRILPPSMSYLLPGSFDTERMLDFLELAITALLEAGHQRILLTGEMTWSIQNAPEAGELARYEDLLNPLATKYPEVTMVCQYDLKRFSGDVILDALLTHPSILISGGRAPGYLGLS